MPDWTYEPLFRPILFRLPPARSRDLTLRALGCLARTPGGPAAIGFLGHMDPPANLATELAGIRFPGPVGLGAGLDADARAFAALARFGFGFIEAGPATVAPQPDPGLRRPGGSATLIYPDPLANPGVAALADRLRALGPLPVPLGARLAIPPGTAPPTAAAELGTLVRTLGPLADYLVVDVPDAWEPQLVIAASSATSATSQAPIWPEAAWAEILAAAVAEARALDPPRPLLLRVPPDAPRDRLMQRFGVAIDAGFAGAVVAGGVAVMALDGSVAAGAGSRMPESRSEAAVAGLGGAGEARRVGAGTRAAAIGTVRALRERWGRRVAIIGSGGIVEPGDALAILDAGADLVQIHSGLVFSGPGLPKRINEALRWRMESAGSITAASPVKLTDPESNAGPPPSPGSPPLWLGFLLLGLLMIIGGGLAWFVGATRVILAYDLAFLGLDRAGVAALNPRLLDFMSHDRITLAGTMISIGVLYTALAWNGIRRREHWARQSIMLSAGIGLASFFLFVFHGYFDPLHFVQWVVALLCFEVGRRWRADAPPVVPMPDLANDRAWRAAAAGQLLFVMLAIGLIGGGLTIAALGATAVFVPEDLEFLQTTRAAVAAANPNLLPLIAHDRAGFGGALVADGLAVLTLALWGFRRGARWVWAALLLAGLPGLVAALGIHLSVGYLDAGHLAPPALALGLYLGGLLLSRSFLCKAN
jgi:dihydroorotate dehydrogenase